MDDEVGGVGSIGDHEFMWVMREGSVDATLANGRALRFTNDSDGWTEFLLFSIVATGQF